ncbi:hypothetical protein KL929_002631 [Ogataea haglerorum]|nr:hypothetical protein KL910_002641 [Ogataea haglerorum]KAG7797788.1 hypothetical protein KL929_002631 [Ogataea haglerorum]
MVSFNEAPDESIRSPLPLLNNVYRYNRVNWYTASTEGLGLKGPAIITQFLGGPSRDYDQGYIKAQPYGRSFNTFAFEVNYFDTIMKFSISAVALVAAKASAITFYASNSSTALEEFAVSGVTGWSNPQFASIYHTCNETNARMIRAGLKDSLEAAAYARARLTEYGKDDEIYERWFGNGSIYEVIGTIDWLVEASKDSLLYRCDDIDGECAANPTTYPGYHREDAPGETVICDLFYTSKKPLANMCFDGSIVSTGPKHYAGIDLLHRYLHVPYMSSDGYIAEYFEELDEILDVAQTNSSFAVRNVDSFLYYIAEVYSEAVIPGGCLGDL